MNFRPGACNGLRGVRAFWLALALAVPAPGATQAVPETPAIPAADAPATPAGGQGGDSADPRAALLAQREAAQQTFLTLSDEQRYEEAATIAAQIIDMTARAYGAEALEMAAPLTNLATLRMRQGQLIEAELGYKQAVALIERHDGPASARLINPLVGLGETYLRGGLYAASRDAYERALRSNHVEAGFYNLEQIRIMDGLSEAYLGLDKLAQANLQQRNQVEIQRRRAGGDSEEVVAALYKLGRWYNRTGQYMESRAAYQQARGILRNTRKDDDPAMVDALVGEAKSYAGEGAMPPSVATLKRALSLLDSQPAPDHLKRAEVLVELGDLHMLGRQPRSARQRYEEAWTELTGDAALEAQRDAYFGRAIRISGGLLPEVVGADGKERDATPATQAGLASGMVLASLTIDADGDADDVKIIESDPPGLLDQKVLRALGSATFRPRMADGAAVPSDEVQFRHEFRYVPATGPAQPVDEPERDVAGDRGERIGYPEQDNAGQSDTRR